MYIRVRISATTAKEANTISRTLVEKKLVAGTMIYSGNCHYWWDGEVVEKKYWNVGAFTLAKHKKAIIKEVYKLHSDKCPIVAFNKVELNKDSEKWIDEYVG